MTGDSPVPPISVRQWLGLCALAGGYFIALLDLTIINLAVPSLTENLGATTAQVFWAVNSYGLILALTIIPSGRLGDRFGHRRLFLLGTIVLAAASLICGLSTSPLILITGRFIQGLGAGLLVPQTLTLIGVTFPEKARGRAVGIWGSIAGTASIVGPLVGGVLIDGLSWRWVFFINLPIAVPVVVLGLRILPIGATQAAKFDLVGTFLAGAGLVALLYGCLQGPHAGWGSVTIACLPVAIVCLLVFLWYERRVDPGRAVFPESLRRNYRFIMAALFGLATALGVFALTFLVSNYVQSVAGQSAFWAGAILAPASIGSVVTAPIAGHWVDDKKGRFVLQIGFGASTLGIALSIVVAVTGVSWLWLLGAMTIFGIGNGFTMAPLTTIGMYALRSDEFSSASSLLNVLRQTGPVLGGAVVGLLIQALGKVSTASDPLGISGSTVAWVLGVLLLLFAAGFFAYSFAPRSLLAEPSRGDSAVES
jgi:EmrB/QacA subfamily drug resistance transporter